MLPREQKIGRKKQKAEQRKGMNLVTGNGMMTP